MLAGLPALSALLGSTSGVPLRLDLGPGDAPYVGGFAPRYEIDDKVSSHWTTYHARVDLPVEISGAVLQTRFARVFGETARCTIAAPGTAPDAFEARGGAWQERSLAVPAWSGPLRLAIDCDSHERRDRGLKLDWLKLQPAGRSRLVGAAALAPALLIALLFGLLRGSGWASGPAALLALPWSLAAAAGLQLDPWLVHRLLRGLPLALLLAGGAGLAIGLALRRAGRVSPPSLQRVFALAVAALLLRALAVNHPDFYYPDLRTHARLVEVVREAGLAFFAHPARHIREHGVWFTEAYGQTYAFPYSPAFHLPFTLLPIEYDTLLLCLKLAAAATSVVPLVLVWSMARRLGVAPLGTALMLLIPVYTSRLSFAFLPSLFGHAVDMGFVLFLMARADRLPERGSALALLGWVCACQLAYVSGVTNASLLVGCLAVATAVLPGGSPRRGALILGLGLVASAVSVALYYRDFLPMVFDVASRAAAGEARAPSRYPVRPVLEVAVQRVQDFFGGLYPLLAAAGLVGLLRREPRQPVVLAWLATFALELAGRARMPDLFLHGHETTLATPLVCLLAGEALASLARRGRGGRIAAGALLAWLAWLGLRGQWAALADQLGNAR